jgi:hypothetical protein
MLRSNTFTIANLNPQSFKNSAGSRQNHLFMGQNVSLVTHQFTTSACRSALHIGNPLLHVLRAPHWRASQMTHFKIGRGKIYSSISSYACVNNVIYILLRLATGWTTKGWEFESQWGARIFITPCRPDLLWGPPSLLPNGYQRLFLPRVKQPGREAKH